MQRTLVDDGDDLVELNSNSNNNSSNKTATASTATATTKHNNNNNNGKNNDCMLYGRTPDARSLVLYVPVRTLVACLVQRAMYMR